LTFATHGYLAIHRLAEHIGRVAPSPWTFPFNADRRTEME
jgi:hypothetical protein